MNSKILILFALCALWSTKPGVESANLGSQWLPLPVAAQRSADTGAPENLPPGEVHALQPQIVLTAKKDLVDQINMNVPPAQEELDANIDIIKKGSGNSEGEKKPKTDVPVTVYDKEGSKIMDGEIKVERTPLGNYAEVKKANGASSMNTNLSHIIITLITTILMISFARSRA